MRNKSGILCAVFILQIFQVSLSSPTTQDAFTTQPQPTKKYTPGYVSATMADAFADVLRTKALSKLQTQTEQVSPQPSPTGPSKSKSFTYTNIRLNTNAQGAPETANNAGANTMSAAIQNKKEALLNLFHPNLVTSSTPISTVGVSGARIPPTQQNAFTTTSAATVPSNVPTSVSSYDMEKRLEEYERLTQLMQQELEAMKQQQQQQSNSGRRLHDNGQAGFDAGLLLQQKVDSFQSEMAALRERLHHDLNAAQMKSIHNTDVNIDTVGSIHDQLSDSMTAKQNDIQALTDSWAHSAETRLGDLQDAWSDLIQRRSERKIDAVQHGGLFDWL